jgi:hypothetical protein
MRGASIWPNRFEAVQSMAEQGTDDFEWLLVLAFPNGGSTALAKLLLSAEGTIALNPRVEE